MFENVKPPEDIFDGVDTGNAPPAMPTQAVPVAPPMPPIEEVPSSRAVSWKPIVIAVTIFVVVGASASIAYFMLASRSTVVPAEVDTESPNAPASTVVPAVVNAPAPVVPAPVEQVPGADTDAPKSTSSAVDRDKDGLTDSEEIVLGTSPTSADTDADGLFDKEEAQTYKTNPLNPDTDGDGYLDGAEVRQGYNPNGTGKLFGTTTP